MVAVGTVSFQQAARTLNVSEPYVVKLVKDGRLQACTIGNRRRVSEVSLARFKKKQDAEIQRALTKLTQESQALGLWE